MTDQFTCAACDGTFDTNTTYAEVQATKIKNWGNIPDDECDVLCEFCHREFMKWMESCGGNA
jgi:hypothetical protein